MTNMRKEGGRGRDGRSGLEGGEKTKATWSETHVGLSCCDMCRVLSFFAL